MKYTIGEFSKMIGVSATNLRFFEKNGLIAPERGESGYRLYSVFDAYRVNTFNMLNTLGYKLSQSAARTEGLSAPVFAAELDRNIREMEREKAMLEKRIEWAGILRDIYANEDRYLMKPFVHTLPEGSFLVCVDEDDMSPSLPVAGIIAELVDILPFSQYGGLFRRDGQDYLGMLCETAVLHERGISTREMLTIPAGNYVLLLCDKAWSYDDILKFDCLREYFPNGLPESIYMLYLMVETLESTSRGFLLLPLG